MTKNRIRVVTLIGQNSGFEIQLDLAIMARMMDIYLKDCPREEKKLSDFSDMVRLYDQLSKLEEEEIAAVDSKIKKTIFGEIEKASINSVPEPYPEI